jgi:hypothetical protein
MEKFEPSASMESGEEPQSSLRKKLEPTATLQEMLDKLKAVFGDRVCIFERQIILDNEIGIGMAYNFEDDKFTLTGAGEFMLGIAEAEGVANVSVERIIQEMVCETERADRDEFYARFTEPVPESLQHTPHPKVLDVILIDGRWAQVRVDVNHINFLDGDENIQSINWDEYRLSKKYATETVSVGAYMLFLPDAITEKEIGQIRWGVEQEQSPELRLLVLEGTVFGEYEKKPNT